MYLITGLGNPGKQYQSTRHNIGFEALDYLSREYALPMTRLKHKAIMGEGIIQGERVILAKPQTYMNLSGESVGDIARYHKIPAENIIVVYDDAALPTGKIRIRPKGSDGGHNGMKSIIYHLATNQFPRIRLGVGSPERTLHDHVLGRFTKEEIKILEQAIIMVRDIVPTIMKAGVEAAMNKYNSGVGER